MTSNKKILLSFIAVLGLLFTGCDKYINGEKSKGEVIELGDEKFKCLKALPENIKKLSIGDAEPEEIRGSVDCLNKALTYFHRRTDGSLSNGDYTTQDMRKFFSKYFLKENKVSPQFADELMKIKKALLGGSDQFMSKTEVLKLVDLMAVVREELVAIAPHIKVILKQDPNTKANWDQVATATDQLRKSLQKILEVSQISKSDYSLDDAKRAFTGLSEFIRGAQPFMPYEQYSQWIPLVESVKNVLMGKAPHFVGLKDWSQGLDNLIDLYSLALKYMYVIRGLEMQGPIEVRQMTQFAVQVLDLIESSHQMSTQGQIPFSDIDNMITQVFSFVKAAEAKRMTSLRAESLKSAYQVFILKILEPQRQGDSRGLTGLERKHIGALRRELNVFRLSQSFIDYLSQSQMQERRNHKGVLEQFAKFDHEHVIDKGLSADPLERVALRNSWKDFEHLLSSPYPVNFSAKGGFLMSYEPEKYEMTWASLTRFNVMRGIARILMLGYGDILSGELSQSKITEEKLIAWYADFREIGLDLKAFDKRTGNSGGRSFLEANFFTLSGDGDKIMNDRETFEFVSVLFSAGLGTSSRIQKIMTSEKCTLPQLDVFDFPLMEESCFKKVLKDKFLDIFDNLPYMGYYAHDLGDEAWDQFFKILMDSSRTSPADGGYVETADLRTMVTVLHYTETIMTIYDIDHSQGLSIEEIKGANPRFIPFFKGLNKTDSETILNEGFIYLVMNGEIPDAWSLAKFQGQRATDYLKSILGLGQKPPEATRASILKIMRTLKDELARQKQELAEKEKNEKQKQTVEAK